MIRRNEMKTGWVIAIVVAVHCIAVGSLLVLQGCGTARGPKVSQETSRSVKLPSPVDEVKPAVQPAVQPVEPPLFENPSAKPAKTFTARTTSYVVKAGDSLGSIAHRFHLTVAELQTLNNIKDAKKVRIGQKLVLPGDIDVGAVPPPKKSPAKPKAPTPAAVEKPAVEGTDNYIVKPGDSLSRIASRFKTSADAIRSANGLTGNNLRVGQKLIIPAGAPKKEAAPKQEKTVAPAATKNLATPAMPAAPAAPAAIPTTATTPVSDSSAAPNVNLSSEPVKALSAPPAVAPAAPAPTTKAAPGKDSSVQTHKVLANEDWQSLAQEYHVSADKIKKFNGLPDDAALKPGQIVKIPVSE